MTINEAALFTRMELLYMFYHSNPLNNENYSWMDIQVVYGGAFKVPFSPYSVVARRVGSNPTPFSFDLKHIAFSPGQERCNRILKFEVTFPSQLYYYDIRDVRERVQINKGGKTAVPNPSARSAILCGSCSDNTVYKAKNHDFGVVAHVYIQKNGGMSTSPPSPLHSSPSYLHLI
jgi:hypothetical protein